MPEEEVRGDQAHAHKLGRSHPTNVGQREAGLEVEGEGGCRRTAKHVGHSNNRRGQHVGREHKDGIPPKVRGTEADRCDDAKVQCAAAVAGAGGASGGTVVAVVGIGTALFFVLHECFVRKLIILLILERGELRPIVVDVVVVAEVDAIVVVVLPKRRRRLMMKLRRSAGAPPTSIAAAGL